MGAVPIQVLACDIRRPPDVLGVRGLTSTGQGGPATYDRCRMPYVTTQQEKAALRAQMREQRKALLACGAHGSLSAQISIVLIETLSKQQNAVVATYSAIGSEVSLTTFHEAAETLQLCLPVVQETSRVLTFHSYDSATPLGDGHHSTRQPHNLGKPVIPNVILLPLLAFDNRGGRLGQGGGYYDATLEALSKQGHRPTLIGIAFACQEVAAVPQERHDVRLDAIATQDGIRYV